MDRVFFGSTNTLGQNENISFYVYQFYLRGQSYRANVSPTKALSIMGDFSNI